MSGLNATAQIISIGTGAAARTMRIATSRYWSAADCFGTVDTTAPAANSGHAPECVDGAVPHDLMLDFLHGVALGQR